MKQLLSFSLFILCLVCSAVNAVQLSVVSPLVSYDSQKSQQMLKTSVYQTDFLPLTATFLSQKNLAYCGVASSVMILNALKIKPPLTPDIYPYAQFNQENLFTPKVLKVRRPVQINHGGMSLGDFAQILKASDAQVKVYGAGQVSFDQFMTIAKKVLGTKDQYLAVNYLRRAMHQEGGGHISPIAAYDQKSDHFLLMDVSRYKYPPVWVPAKDLYAAMKTKDGKQYRGFVVVSKE